MKRNEEIKALAVDNKHKEKTINDLLDRLSWKDQEIGRLSDEIRAQAMMIEAQQKDIEKLQKTDLLDRISQKDQQIGKISDELTTAKDLINNLKKEIEKLQKSELLDRLATKDQVIGKLANDLKTASKEIKTLKKNIGKLSEIDLQMEETKKEVDNNLNNSVGTVNLLPGENVDNISKETTE